MPWGTIVEVIICDSGQMGKVGLAAGTCYASAHGGARRVHSDEMPQTASLQQKTPQ